jgi:cell division protein FtsB
MNRITLRWTLRGAASALAIVLIMLSLATWSVYQRERIAESEARAAAAEHAELAARKAALEANLNALEAPRGVEAAIRERYPVVRPGEEVITLVDVPPGASTTASVPHGIWDSVRNWLGW